MNTCPNRFLMIVAIISAILPVIKSDAAAVGAHQQADSTLTIHNNSDDIICHVFITVYEATTWGRDWLGDEDDIAPGTSYSFTLPEGVYYVMVADCKLNIMAKARRLHIAGTQDLYYTGTSLSTSEGVDSADNHRSDLLEQARDTPCYSSAPQTLRELLDLCIDLGDPLELALILGLVASEHGRIGQHRAALTCYLEELALYQQIQAAELEAITLNNVGATYRYLSQYQKALTYYLDALDRWQMLGEPANEAVTRDNIGVVYQYLRQFDNALVYHHQALALFQQVQDASGQGSALNNIGLAEAYSGHYEEAAGHFLQALDIWQERDEPANEAITLTNIGFAYYRTGRHQESLDHFQQALAVVKQHGQEGLEGGILTNIGAVHDSMGSYEQALDYYQQALDILQRIGDQEGAASALIDIGFTFEQLGDTPQAVATYQQAIEVVESIQGSIQVESFQSTYAAAQVPVYEHLISLLWGNGQGVEAFAYAERARARALLDQIGNQQVDFRQSSAPELIAEEQALRQRIIGLQNTLTAERSKPLDQQSQELLGQLSVELEGARSDHEGLMNRLKLESPEYASLVSVSTLTLEQVQEQVLDQNTTLIEYFVLDDQVLVWVIDQQGFEWMALEIGRDDLQNQVEFLGELIDTRDFDTQVAAGLHDVLFAPLKPHIRHANLVIVPHGVLHYLPFAALWDAEREHYLVQDYAVTYAPSASALQYILAKRNADEGRLLALGNPDGSLLHSGTEAQAIAGLYDTAPLLGEEATESQIYARAGQVDLLHLAAHGVYNPYNPLYSRIELAADDAQDGNLEVHEVFGLDLTGANLVVLSACETALGEQSEGDELVGLTRAFLYAGTPAVVTTLWSIDDAASGALMESFYRHLREGLTNAEALRAAQLAVLGQGGWSQPYYWAAFSLTGDYRGSGEPKMAMPSPRQPTQAVSGVGTPTSLPAVEPSPTPGAGRRGLCAGAALPLGLAFLGVFQQRRVRRRKGS